MAFGNFNQNQSGTHAMAEINMIPLIDVMLVLLVIFMIAAPMMTHAVKIDLPKVSSQAQTANPQQPINLSIDGQGQLFWDTTGLSRQQLQQRLQALANQTDSPEVHLRADRNVAYHYIAETLADAANAGVSKIGFISEPEQTH